MLLLILVYSVLFGDALQWDKVDLKIAVLYSNINKHPLREIIELALDDINNRSEQFHLRVLYQEYHIQSNDVFESVCTILEQGVVGIVASGTSNYVKLIAELATNFHVPVLTPSATNPFIQTDATDFLLNLMPSDFEQCKAIFSFLQRNKWTEFSILTSDDDYGINGMLKLQSLALSNGYRVHSNQQFATPVPDQQGHDGEDIPDVRLELKVIKDSLSKIIVLIADGWYSTYIFQQAQEMGLMTREYAWIVTDGITTQPQTLENKDQFVPLYLNGLLGTRPTISTQSTVYKNLYRKFGGRYPTKIGSLGGYVLTIYDTMQVFAEGLNNYFVRYDKIIAGTFNCHQSYVERLEQLWDNGTQLMEALKRVQISGMAGNIAFDGEGWPKNVIYDILNIQNGQFVQIGEWHKRSNRLLLPRKALYFEHESTTPTSKPRTLKGSHFVCGILPSEPFIMEAKGPCDRTNCYSGYMIDLIQKLSADLDFTYEFVQPSDGLWGAFDNTTKQWTGLVRELMDRRIDMGTVPLSVNSVRGKVIDFSFPFMDASNTAVFRAEQTTSNNFFFLLPFEDRVWYSIIVMNFVVTLCFYLANKTSPYGRSASYVHALMTCECKRCLKRRRQLLIEDCSTRNKYRCLFKEGEAKNKRNGTNLYNSAWIVSTGLFGKTRGDSPDSMSGRFIVMSWWFFMMVVLSMYTANLAASLTVNNMAIGIKSVKDLLNQKEITWGTVTSTHTDTILKDSVDPFYKELSTRSFNVANSSEGIRRVMEDKFVFIFETPIIDYAFHSSCDVVRIGSEFQSFEYALGFPKGAPYAELIDSFVLQYREFGILDKFWARWLKMEKSTSCRGGKHGNKGSLGMSSMAGTFLALSVALGISVLVLFIEYGVVTLKDRHRHNHHHDRKITFKEALFRRINLLLSYSCPWYNYNDDVPGDQDLEEGCMEVEDRGMEECMEIEGRLSLPENFLAQRGSM